MVGLLSANWSGAARREQQPCPVGYSPYVLAAR